MRWSTLLLSILATSCVAAPLHFQQSAFTAGSNGRPEGWSTWSARAETAPRMFVDQIHSRSGPGSLAISANSNAAAYGGWERTLKGVEPGQWYRFVAYYRAEAVAYELGQVVARLDWTNAQGKRAGQPDYGYQVIAEGEWKKIMLEAPAPAAADSVRIQLFFGNSPQATVFWDDISLEQIPAPGPRKVVVAAVNLRPSDTHSAAESVRQFVQTVDEKLREPVDVILLPEGITVVGTGKNYEEVAEVIPGPTTLRLGEMAQRHKAWVVAGIYEREGQAIYNTAVLIDRAGQVTGKYRKVYLPREEIEAGLTPGSDYPVFRTDFGKVGMMICWDLQYADPARALALNGAEIVLLPIWGGNLTLGKARAIENHVFLASSGYDYPTQIVDPTGEVLSVAREQGAAAVATLDLNRRYVEPWLGEMKGRFAKELRLDVKVEPSVAWR